MNVKIKGLSVNYNKYGSNNIYWNRKNKPGLLSGVPKQGLIVYLKNSTGAEVLVKVIAHISRPDGKIIKRTVKNLPLYGRTDFWFIKRSYVFGHWIGDMFSTDQKGMWNIYIGIEDQETFELLDFDYFEYDIDPYAKEVSKW